MSIVVLKKKSERFKLGESISGKGKNGFSLNGGRRSQGWVGQDLRGRHLSRTLYRGLAPVGHGGCCGTYPKKILGQPSCSANDPNIIKRSTMSTPAHIATTYVHPTSIFNFDCSGNCRTVMVSVAPQVPDYSIYIAAKAQAAMFCPDVITDGSGSQITCYTDRYIDDTYSSTTIQTLNLGVPTNVANTTLVPPTVPDTNVLLFNGIAESIVTAVSNINFTSDIARVYGTVDGGISLSFPITFPDPIPGIDPPLENFSVRQPEFPSATGLTLGTSYGEWFLEYSTVVAGGGTKYIPGCKASRRIGGKKRPLTPYYKDMRGAETGSWFNEYRVKHNNCLPPPLCKAPWPITVSRKCQNNYLTAAEAMAAGALPPDWMNCLPGTTPGKTDYSFSSY
jgi:hypothetical protein